MSFVVDRPKVYADEDIELCQFIKENYPIVSSCEVVPGAKKFFIVALDRSRMKNFIENGMEHQVGKWIINIYASVFINSEMYELHYEKVFTQKFEGKGCVELTVTDFRKCVSSLNLKTNKEYKKTEFGDCLSASLNDVPCP
jgi:hypothetical protein